MKSAAGERAAVCKNLQLKLLENKHSRLVLEKYPSVALESSTDTQELCFSTRGNASDFQRPKRDKFKHPNILGMRSMGLTNAPWKSRAEECVLTVS